MNTHTLHTYLSHETTGPAALVSTLVPHATRPYSSERPSVFPHERVFRAGERLPLGNGPFAPIVHRLN